MKRVGCIYEQMAEWHNIVEAEAISTRRKQTNFGVKKHLRTRMRNLCEIQEFILTHNMHTSEYRHENMVSGQDKMRDIAKLHFHPSHIQHQLLTMMADQRIDRALIRHTYASRKGYGQCRAALRIRDYLRRYRNDVVWYCQGDIEKYYASIPHSLIRANISRFIKDKEFVNAFMEPFEVFSPSGVGIPLGIRPSQTSGNVTLMQFDRFMTETLQCKGFTRYLDDFVFFGKTKGEVKWRMKRAMKFLQNLGFNVHPPKIHRISTGLDMLGYIFRNNKSDMFWRRADKRRWLRRRHRVSNPRRLRELDAAAWGMLKWGNRHCKRLFKLKSSFRFKNMVKLSNCGLQRTVRKDANGLPFIEGKSISMGVLLGKTVEVIKWVGGIKTSQGPGRYALQVNFMGDVYKLIVNSVDIKTFLADMDKNKVTRFKTVFVNRESNHYTIDFEQTEILEVDGRRILEMAGKVIFADTKEEVIFATA